MYSFCSGFDQTVAGIYDGIGLPLADAVLSKRVETSNNELNAEQHIFEWKIFTQKGVRLWIIHSQNQYLFQSVLPFEIVLSFV